MLIWLNLINLISLINEQFKVKVMKRKTVSVQALASIMILALLASCNDPYEYEWPNNNDNETNDDETVDDGIQEDTLIVYSDDIFSSEDYTRSVSVTFSESGNANVSGADGTDIIATINGNDVTITNNTDDAILYILSGSTGDGYFKLYSDHKQAVKLSGASIANPDGAAINIQSGKRCFIGLSGTNSIADGATDSSGDYPDQTQNEDEDMKAALFSEGPLIFCGDGSLTVTATGKSGICSDDYVRIEDSGLLNITASAGHGIKSNEGIFIDGGTTDITVSGIGRKAITTDYVVQINGGTTSITVSGSAGTVDSELTGTAGVKCDKDFLIENGTLTITASGKGSKGINCDSNGFFRGGTVNVTASGANYGNSSDWGGQSSNSVSAKAIKFDGKLEFSGAAVTAKCSSHEGIESKSTIEISGGSVYSYAYDDAINSASTMTITGGYVFAQGTKNDGLDANGNLYIKGGTIYAIGCGSPEVAIDANTEGGYKLYISGGNIIAIGGIESGASLSQPVASSNSWSKNTSYALADGDSIFYAFKTPASGGTGIYMSSPSMKTGTSYTLKSGATINGGQEYFEGMLIMSPSDITGGTSSTVTASTSTSGNGDDKGRGDHGPGHGW